MDVQCGWGFFLFFLSGIFPVVWREDVWFFCNFFRNYGNFAGVLLRFWGVFAQFLQTSCVLMHNVYWCTMCVLYKVLQIFFCPLCFNLVTFCHDALWNYVILWCLEIFFCNFYHFIIVIEALCFSLCVLMSVKLLPQLMRNQLMSQQLSP